MSNPFVFDLSPSTIAPSSTGNTIVLTATQEASGSGFYQSVAPGSILIFRFGIGFGTLNNVLNLRVTPWFSSTPSATPVTAADFAITTNLTAGKVTLTYTPATAHDLAFRDQICIDANWDAPSASPGNIVDFNNNVASGSNFVTIGKMLFVQ